MALDTGPTELMITGGVPIGSIFTKETASPWAVFLCRASEYELVPET